MNQKVAGLCIIPDTEPGSFKLVLRQTLTRKKQDNETFTQGVTATGRPSGHICVCGCSESSSTVGAVSDVFPLSSAMQRIAAGCKQALK
jgi:hypothetical protein